MSPTTLPGLFAGAWRVALVELAELRSSPGLYLFIALILLETVVPALVAVGFLGTPLLVTSGLFAVRLAQEHRHLPRRQDSGPRARRAGP